VANTGFGNATGGSDVFTLTVPSNNNKSSWILNQEGNMSFGYFVKRNDNDFVINVGLNILDSGYNVVPKSIDKWNAYDIAEVQAYAQLHPEMEVIWDGEKYIPKEV